jgi:putative resolvase
MKAKEVLKILNVSRITLCTYVRKGYIKTTLLPNGYYDYDEQSVYQFLGKNNRANFIYARVSTYKQKKDLLRQIKLLTDYSYNNDIEIKHIYSG